MRHLESVNKMGGHHPPFLKKGCVNMEKKQGDKNKTIQKEEAMKRSLSNKFQIVFVVLAILWGIFHLIITAIFPIPSINARSIDLMFLLTLTFLLYKGTKTKSPFSRPSILDIVLIICALVPTGYIAFFQERIQMELFTSISFTNIIFGTMLIFVLFEATRRVVGWQLVIISIAFLIYAKFGAFFPSFLELNELNWGRIVETIYLTQSGIFGVALGAVSDFIFMFIMFGAFMKITGLGDFFNDLALALVGQRRGGPAKVALIFSGFLGMISGTAAGNAATTGAFTIPLMKRIGFKADFAASVEAVASTGGQILPPVMGAVAFVMAEMLGISYVEVMIAAIVPALLFYLATYFAIDLETFKKQLKGIPEEELPNLIDVIKARGYLVIPIIVLLVFMLRGYSPTYAVFYAIIVAVLVSFIRKQTRVSLKGLINTFTETAEGVVSVGIACAVVGIVIGIAGLTSIGTSLGNSILGLAGDNLLLLLIFTMLVTIVLGMGLATVPAFILTSIVSANILLQSGVDDLTSHMFILYFAILGTITPPVAITAYVAAGIAGSNASKTGWTAFRLALPGFFIPFFFVYHPQMLLQNLDWTFPFLLILNIIGIYTLTLAIQGFWRRNLTIFERAFLLIITLSMIYPNWISSGIGLFFFVILWLLQTKNINSKFFPTTKVLS